MKFRSHRFALFALIALVSARPASALDVVHKSVSLSRQFVVYCSDANARAQIAGFADETKKNTLSLLGLMDQWRFPIVIKVEPARAATPLAAASTVQFCETDEGGKIEIDVSLGADPRVIRFEEQVIRAVLIDLAYRDQPPAAGMAYAEPPAWLIEGASEIFHHRDADTHAAVFRTLLNNDHLPRLSDFLQEDGRGLEPESRRLHAACAMALVELLTQLPDGKTSLLALLRNLPRNGDAGAPVLNRAFPALGANAQSMEKWWALSVARLSAADRFQGLSLAETELRLASLLVFEVGTEKAGEMKSFTLDQFMEFRKLPGWQAALSLLSSSLVALGTQASPLIRPVISDYQLLTSELARGKTRKVAERLAAAAKYRELVLTRMTEIADYLNWFEATQVTTKSNSFADYIRIARELAHDTPKREDGITRYLDVVQQQVE